MGRISLAALQPHTASAICRRDLSHHGMRQHDAQGADHHIRPGDRSHDGVFSRCPPVGPGLEHLGGGDGIGSQGDDLHGFAKVVFYFLDDGAADAAALAIDNTTVFRKAG
jgi:hypothetical protein